MITASIVLWNKAFHTEKLVESFLNLGRVRSVFLVDNSCGRFRELSYVDDRVIYINPGVNLGFGAAHNIAIKRAVEIGSRYHFIANPDVEFDTYALNLLLDFVASSPDIGVVAPKVLYPDGSIQYTCRLLPTPWQLFKRRFLGVESDEVYELRFTGYSRIMDVPFIIGCFWLLNVEVLMKVGLFDERYFLYMEDVDLCRRIFRRSFRVVFFPYSEVVHEHQRASYREFKPFFLHASSAIKYFNKWGWFEDREREEINEAVLRALYCIR